jgi:hypothetical protein
MKPNTTTERNHQRTAYTSLIPGILEQTFRGKEENGYLKDPNPEVEKFEREKGEKREFRQDIDLKMVKAAQ